MCGSGSATSDVVVLRGKEREEKKRKEIELKKKYLTVKTSAAIDTRLEEDKIRFFFFFIF